MNNRYDVNLNNKYLNKLFDCIRVVNPIEKNIIEKNNVPCNSYDKCYHVWNRNKICENCISLRAYNENTTFVKIEYNGDRIYWVMATPVNKKENKFVIETIKDITDCKIIDNLENKTAEELHDEIRRMNKLVVTDELTECYNRRYINEKLLSDMNLAKSSGEKLSIAMIDIDYFKKINDNYSHLAGDFILKEITKIIKCNISAEKDWLARYGGEEFLVVFNNASNDIALNLCNRIKALVEKSVFIYDEKEISLTISIGVGTLTDKINNIEEFIEIADKNLYKAKKNGRNLVI